MDLSNFLETVVIYQESGGQEAHLREDPLYIHRAARGLVALLVQTIHIERVSGGRPGA
jgi:hypothetical protein